MLKYINTQEKGSRHFDFKVTHFVQRLVWRSAARSSLLEALTYFMHAYLHIHTRFCKGWDLVSIMVANLVLVERKTAIFHIFQAIRLDWTQICSL